MSSKLDPVLSPRSVAVIGASRDPVSMSGRLYRNLRDTFQGAVYPVNPHVQAIEGVRTFGSVLEIPAPVELAFVAVPAAFVLDVVRQCVAKHVRALVVITAGYSETGVAGTDRERQLLALVRSAGIPMVGPNCFGVINTDPAVGLMGVFSPLKPACGNVAFGSQSGALGVVIPDFLAHWQIGLSSFVSIGNKADVGENDLLLHWERDRATRLIALYLESFQDPRRFLEEASRISRKKPIVVLKAGRTGAGTRAASSHTAALASQDAAAAALLRQAGVIRAETLEELFDVAALLSTQPVPQGRRVAVLGNAGGPAVLCADVVESSGLCLPELSPPLQDSLRSALPPEASVHNPVDLVGTIDENLYRQTLRPLLASSEVDAVITIYVPRESSTTPLVARAIRETAGALAAGKPVLGVFMQTALVPEAVAGPLLRIPSFLFPEAAARALALASQYRHWLHTPPGAFLRLSEGEKKCVRSIVAPALERAGAQEGWLDIEIVLQVLTSSGLQVPRWLLAASAGQAVEAAKRWDTSVVLKVIAPSALHKTEVGGVLVNLRGEQEIHDAYERVLRAVPDARGVLVQEYVPQGHEAFIGANRDPAFGPLIACGLGGTLVELGGDIAFSLHPLAERDAVEMVDSGRLGRVLSGYRRRPPGDRAALIDALKRVSALIDALPEIVEMDLNPVLVLPPPHGVSVVDARIRVARAGLSHPSEGRTPRADQPPPARMQPGR